MSLGLSWGYGVTFGALKVIFDMIKFPREHSRGGRLSSTMKRFLEVIKDLELRDILLQRGPFHLGW